MTAQAPKGSDPLIDEVRQRRREMMQEHGNDLRKLFEAIQRRQVEHPESCVDRRPKEDPRSRRRGVGRD
jgi:hypothetical protein